MKYESRSLQRVADGDLCAGCGLCEFVARGKVFMETSDGGYKRPRQFNTLSECEEKTIADTCPGLKLGVDISEPEDHPLWGRVNSIKIGHASDSKIRFMASSGGALSAFLTYLLESSEVDFVVTNKSDDVVVIGNQSVIVADPEKVTETAGSRYAPSSPLSHLEEYLSTGKRFAFVGKPCDVSALRALARHDRRIDLQVPYVLSFFCAGVPSLSGGKAVVKALGCNVENVRSFRYRGFGWPGMATATLHDGSIRQMSYADSWGGILSSKVQFRCKICPDGVGSSADIVCADAWHCDDAGYPLFEEQDGESLILARTETGKTLLSKAIADGAVSCKDIGIEKINAMQPGQLGRKSVLFARLLALRLMGRPVPVYINLKIRESARYSSVPKKFRNFSGMIRRQLEKVISTKL